MVAAEAAAAGSPPLVARHSGLAEVAAGIEAELPERLRHLVSFERGDAADLRRKLEEILALLAAPTTTSCAARPAEPSNSAGPGPASPPVCSSRLSRSPYDS